MYVVDAYMFCFIALIVYLLYYYFFLMKNSKFSLIDRIRLELLESKLIQVYPSVT